MPEKLDERDISILHLLQMNCKIPTSELSRLVYLSRSAVEKKVIRLERLGYIKRYKAVIDKVNVNKCFLCYMQIELSDCSNKCINTLREFIGSINAVVNAFTVSGPFDFLVYVATANKESYLEIYTQMLNLEGVKSVRSFVVIEELKEANFVDLADLMRKFKYDFPKDWDKLD